MKGPITIDNDLYIYICNILQYQRTNVDPEKALQKEMKHLPLPRGSSLVFRGVMTPATNPVAV